MSNFEYDRESEILYHLQRGPVIVPACDLLTHFAGTHGWLDTLNRRVCMHVAFETNWAYPARVRLEIAHAPGSAQCSRRTL